MLSTELNFVNNKMENKKEDVKSQPDESTVTKEHGEKEMEELPWIQYFYP